MSYLEDDGTSPEVTAVEEKPTENSGEHQQAMNVRVGPVFRDEGQDTAPGIWVTYQEQYLNSSLSGPVLLDAATWRALNRAVEDRLRRWEFRRQASLWTKLRRRVMRS